MLQIQGQYLEYFDALKKELSFQGVDNQDIGELRRIVEDTELIVPVVGAFSAGKSSLINSLLGQDYLPVDVTPETALATEIRYAQRDHIEAVKADGSYDTYDITAISDVKAQAGDYQFMRVYLNVDIIQSIEPLVLVDMPGFDAPIDLHNRAIINYLDRGVSYICLVSVEDGNVTRSMLRRLTEIKESGADFSVFVSKINLKSETEVDEVKCKIKDQISDAFDENKEIIGVGNDGGAELGRLVQGIDPESLFQDMFAPYVQDNFHTILNDLNFKVSALEKNQTDNEDAIRMLREKAEVLISKRDTLIDEAKERYSDASINRVVEAVARDLGNAADELVNSAISGGEDGLSRVMNEIIRGTLIDNLNSEVETINSTILDDFSCELASLETTMTSFSQGDKWLLPITESIGALGKGLSAKLAGTAEKLALKSGEKMANKFLSGALKVTGFAIGPLVGALMLVLPELVELFLEKPREEKQKEQIRNQLLTTIIPAVKRSIRMKTSEILNSQVGKTISAVSAKFSDILKEQENAIAAMEEKKKCDFADVATVLNQYKNAMVKIRSLAQGVVYSVEKN
jgi:GTPase SAR1 family protein